MNLEWRKKPQTSIHPLVTLSARLSHYRGLSWARNGTVEERDKGNEKGMGAGIEGRGPGQGWARDGEPGRMKGSMSLWDSRVYPQGGLSSVTARGQMDREEVQWEDIYANSSMSLLPGVLNTV